MPHPKSVISTEGALLRRSGEIPVLALFRRATTLGALPFAFLQRVGYRAKPDRSPQPHFNSVILSGAQRSRRTCHTTNTSHTARPLSTTTPEPA
jgi:hypothetical protein